MEIESPQFLNSEASPGLADVSEQTQSELLGVIDQVGMSRIQLPLRLRRGKELLYVPSLVDFYVSLDRPEAKGIHMSRLFGLLGSWADRGDEALSAAAVQSLMNQAIQSQQGLSASAYLRIDLQLPLARRALISDLYGWRQYPVSWEIEKSVQSQRATVGFEILYSSTCPASAALAEQALREQLAEETVFSRLPALPHAQRSRAQVQLVFEDMDLVFALESLIDEAERVLATPVQTAVKRVDELEFGRLNAQNRMFCEDAVRRLKVWAEDKKAEDYSIEVRHEESLHPHDAVARVVKGVSGGFRWGRGRV